MTKAENGTEDGADDALRRYIDRLEEWPEDAPPTPAELRAVRQDIRLTQDDRDKLEILAENHIRRANSALVAGAYDQAAAELARAAQLRPMDPRPRVELAEVYLQRSLERGYGRNDRQKAVRLAQKALELNPGDPEAQRFLSQYRRMHADFTSAKYRKFAVPAVVVIVILAAMGWWRRDWVVGLFDAGTAAPGTAGTLIPGETAPVERKIPTDIGNLADGSMEVAIESARVGRRNDSSFLDIEGSIGAREAALGVLSFTVRARDADGTAIFTFPVVVRDRTDPVLMPGDTAPLRIFRWLPGPETDVSLLELSSAEIDLMESVPERRITDAEIVWNVPRPEGVSLEAEVRDRRVIEAVDRQVLILDLALENTGTRDVEGMSLGLSIGPEWPDYPISTRGRDYDSLPRGERRVGSLALGFPLEADLSERPLTVRITAVGR